MKRGEIWVVQFDPVVGHEQRWAATGAHRVVGRVERAPGNLVTVLPLTSKPRGLPSRIRVVPPEGGLSRESWVSCEQVRTVSTRRLQGRVGALRPATMAKIEEAVRLLLDW
jgi:mRNA interferase MazF